MSRALEALPWVRQVQVDLPRQQAYVIVAAGSYDRAATLNALAQAGYRGTVLKEEPIDTRLSMNR